MRALLAALALLVAPAAAVAAPPTTGFESSGGAAFTTHEEELAFLAAVAAGSERVRLDVIGQSAQGRPLHLLQVAAPPVGPETARERPTAMLVCSQHGNEPAGREACLALLRDLAYTDDPALVSLLSSTTLLFVPSANPDG